MTIIWVTDQDIDNKYNFGVSDTYGSLHGLDFVMTIDGETKTVTFDCSANALNQTTLINALNAEFVGAVFSVNFNNSLIIDQGTTVCVIGSGTSNAVFGFSTGTNLVSSNAIISDFFGITPSSAYWKRGAIDFAKASAGAMVESYLRRRYEIPATLDPVPQDLKLIATIIAGYNLQVYRGFNPKTADNIDNFYYKEYEWALSELDAYGSSKIHPNLAIEDRFIPIYTGNRVGTYISSGGIPSGLEGSGRGY